MLDLYTDWYLPFCRAWIAVFLNFVKGILQYIAITFRAWCYKYGRCVCSLGLCLTGPPAAPWELVTPICKTWEIDLSASCCVFRCWSLQFLFLFQVTEAEAEWLWPWKPVWKALRTQQDLLYLSVTAGERWKRTCSFLCEMTDFAMQG